LRECSRIVGALLLLSQKLEDKPVLSATLDVLMMRFEDNRKLAALGLGILAKELEEQPAVEPGVLEKIYVPSVLDGTIDSLLNILKETTDKPPKRRPTMVGSWGEAAEGLVVFSRKIGDDSALDRACQLLIPWLDGKDRFYAMRAAQALKTLDTPEARAALKKYEESVK
jgi:hypothetical protein